MEISSKMEETFETLSIFKTYNQPHSDHLMVSNEHQDNNSPLVKQLGKLLFRRMLVGVNDGRFFMGTFHCIDKQGNIILQDAVEYRSIRRNCPSPMEQRCLGLILIPSSCRTSCHVDCSVEEQMSLLSLQN
uniref:Small nuclear ribonucleoprotein-associated protein B n=1 Tax=Anthurium amnicola TaxID=1678845 RepID=A0A1D1ZI91_9ARAE